MLVVTFDDGYKDNFQNAAPVLAEFGLPATFYVTTKFIGSDSIAPWDLAIGISSHWMSWSDVTELAVRGFEIGAHTEHHVDLNRVNEKSARKEIEDSKQTLQNKLGKEILHFAYPFGGVDNFSEDRRDLVAAADFVSCVSCHGGLVGKSDDSLNLRREPISSRYLSPYHFGCEVLSSALRSKYSHFGKSTVTTCDRR